MAVYNTYRCDRCETEHKGLSFPLNWKTIHVRETPTAMHSTYALDLCQFCADELARWHKGYNNKRNPV